MQYLLSATLALALVLPAAATAAKVRFDDAWREQRFSLFSSNDFALDGAALDVRSDGTVSMVWAPVSRALWQSRSASWQWQVSAGVPPTDLTAKGGDDRNLALYFVFLPQSVAERAKGQAIGKLLDEPGVRVLMYVWGGDRPAGTILPTPYLGARGRTIIRRPAGTGAGEEAVDLAADHLAAFGEPAASLVGLAVSADSDDTDTHIEARIEALRLLN